MDAEPKVNFADSKLVRNVIVVAVMAFVFAVMQWGGLSGSGAVDVSTSHATEEYPFSPERASDEKSQALNENPTKRTVRELPQCRGVTQAWDGLNAIRRGSWRYEDVDAATKLAHRVVKDEAVRDKIVASFASRPKATKLKLGLTRQASAKTACVVGVGSGADVVLALAAPNIELVRVIEAKPTAAQMRVLNALKDADPRLALISGSFMTEKKKAFYYNIGNCVNLNFVALQRTTQTCDVLFVNESPQEVTFYNTSVQAHLMCSRQIVTHAFNTVVMDTAHDEDLFELLRTSGTARLLYRLFDTVAGEKGATAVSPAGGVTVLQYTNTLIPCTRPAPAEIYTTVARLDDVQRNQWNVDLAPFNKLAERLHNEVVKKRKLYYQEGHSKSLMVERQIYAHLASDTTRVKRICEIGFNAGHSASLWLLANPTAEVLFFDLFHYPYSQVSYDWLTGPENEAVLGKDARKRLTVVSGSSLDMVRVYAAEHPDVKCDILSVDGGHTYEIAVQDIVNMLSLANPVYHVLFVDDTNCHEDYCVEHAMVESMRRGVVKPSVWVGEVLSKDTSSLYKGPKGFMRGVTVLQYDTTQPIMFSSS